MNEWKKIKRKAKQAGDAELPGLYLEVFGAGYSGAVTSSRARESIIEACEEMIHMAKKIKSNESAVSLESINAKLDRILAWMSAVKPTGFDGTVSVNGKAAKIEVMKEEPKKEEKPKVEEPKKEEAKITIEVLRATATKYSNAFGMTDLLACVGKFDGAKKLSGVAESNYAMLNAEMEARLAREGEKKPEEPKAEAKPVTLDEIKPKAKAFMDKNGTDALAALLKSFGAAKLSEVKSDKYPALLEALVNA